MPLIEEPAATLCCTDAMADALGSVRAEGLDPGPYGLSLCEAMARGELAADEAVALLVAHHRR